MSILSTNKKLISIGAEYSAGQGIDITNHIISVVESAVGANYSAGPNIDIYDVEGQPTISSKDWTNDIEQASANAYEQAIAQIPEPQDLSYLSGRIDTNTSGIDYISSVCLTAHQDWTDTIKGASSYSYEQSTSYFDNWISGQYTGDITNITNKITALSGNFGDYYKKTETSSKDEINDALQYVSANAGKVYEGVSPIVVNNTEDKISADIWTFSAGSNVSFVDDNVNKITRIDVELPQPQDLSYISAQTDKANQGVDYLSGVVITALPSDMATTGDVAELAQTISETYQTKGDYLVRSDSANFYPTNNPSGFITGVDLSNYYTKDETSGKEELANAFANIPVGDPEVNAYVTSNSASIDESTNLVQSNSSTWNDVTVYQSNSANYLTAIDIPESATWNETSNVVQSNSAQWSEGGAGDEEVNSFVYNNSATINEVNTTYQENSGAYLTAVDLTPYQTIEDMTAYQPVSSMTSYANRFQLISVSSNLSAAIQSLDESITTGVVGNLHNYDIKGLNLYGVTSTSSYPSTGYVPSFTSNVASHNSDGQTNVWGLETANMSQWNGKPYVSISSNGNNITGNYKCKVFYLFDGIANKSWQSQNPFSGEIGTLDKDNLIVYNNYVKPSYFTNNGISNFSTKLVFSSNDGGYHPFDVVLTFGDLGVTGTNTISGIFVPSAADLSNYYKKTETSSKQEINNAVNNLFNYFGDATQYVQSNSGRIDFAVESYFTSGGLFLDCYNNVNTNSGAWSQGGTSLTGDAQGAVDNVYTNSGKYVFNNATDCGIGNGCTGTNNSLAQGYNNSAKQTSLAQGHTNTAVSNSFAQGTQNSANDMSFAQGKSACAYNHSLAQGYLTTAMWNSVAVGNGSLAKGQSIAVGDRNQAESNSQAFGNHVSATNSGMAIGTYNNITTGAFVIGNGKNSQRSDCFIIDHDGNVSACGKISANGVELGAGGASNPEVESYVQTNSANIDDTVTSYQTNSGDYLKESELGYNAVDEVSAINGSAIAQYGAEKQWLVHDDTLVHASNSAQYALGVNVSAIAQLLGVDETVLFSATDSTGSTAQTITLSEPYTAFKRIKMYYSIDDGDAGMAEILTTCNKINCYTQCSQAPVGGICMYKGERYYLVNDNQIIASPSASMIYWNNGTNDSTTQTGKCQSYAAFRVHEIYGIGRKQ